jgi:hypothetical protein
MNDENPILSDLSVNEASNTSKEVLHDIKVDLLSSPPLLGRVIGLSSSEPDDLAQLGLSALHWKDLLIEVYRYLLSSGASIAYGGDLRNAGLTEMLIELVTRHKFSNQDQSDRLRSFLAFPLSLSLSAEKEAQYVHRIKFTKVPPPADVLPIDLNTSLPAEEADNLYIWSRCLTNMRESMEKECHARIFVGGKYSNYKGIGPGLLEEILISLKSETPLYLIGGYGGVVADVVSQLSSKNELKNKLENITHVPAFQEMYQTYQNYGTESLMQWPEELLDLTANGWQSIASLNGLSIEENQILSESNNTYEIIFFILKGLIKAVNPKRSI